MIRKAILYTQNRQCYMEAAPQGEQDDEAETAEPGNYLYARFWECFRNPDRIELGDVYDCLRAKVPG